MNTTVNSSIRLPNFKIGRAFTLPKKAPSFTVFRVCCPLGRINALFGRLIASFGTVTALLGKLTALFYQNGAVSLKINQEESD